MQKKPARKKSEKTKQNNKANERRKPMATISQNAQGKVKQQQIDAVVIRCGCGKPHSHAGKVCPKGKREDHGTIAYWHKNPLRRLWFKITKAFNKVVHV